MFFRGATFVKVLGLELRKPLSRYQIAAQLNERRIGLLRDIDGVIEHRIYDNLDVVRIRDLVISSNSASVPSGPAIVP